MFTFLFIGLTLESPIPSAHSGYISTKDASFGSVQPTAGSSLHRRRSLNDQAASGAATTTTTRTVLNFKSTAKSSLTGISRFATKKMVGAFFGLRQSFSMSFINLV